MQGSSSPSGRGCNLRRRCPPGPSPNRYSPFTNRQPTIGPPPVGSGPSVRVAVPKPTRRKKRPTRSSKTSSLKSGRAKRSSLFQKSARRNPPDVVVLPDDVYYASERDADFGEVLRSAAYRTRVTSPTGHAVMSGHSIKIELVGGASERAALSVRTIRLHGSKRTARS